MPLREVFCSPLAAMPASLQSFANFRVGIQVRAKVSLCVAL